MGMLNSIAKPEPVGLANPRKVHAKLQMQLCMQTVAVA